jgi:hypothetical protein
MCKRFSPRMTSAVTLISGTDWIRPISRRVLAGRLRQRCCVGAHGATSGALNAHHNASLPTGKARVDLSGDVAGVVGFEPVR